jgi:hypothetical protein
MMPRPRKKYSEMNTDELAEAMREYDRDFAFLKGRPLTARERKPHAGARKRGRPRVGLGAEKIRVSVERGLLTRSDAFARKHKLTRSEMIARGLRAVLVAAGESKA